ncbi:MULTISPECIES: hypothetical protein [unclassified Meiothermus]|uniref:hypothetical protein n=1 Tax=unclassified Meiothermus TaxID=370471 RepID=UPI001F2A8599|nr:MULTISPECIES: hypothetical protein [unclassified Meiothermus]
MPEDSRSSSQAYWQIGSLSCYTIDSRVTVTKHFDSDFIDFILRKTQAADSALDNQWFFLTAESSGYEISLYPQQVQLGQRVSLMIKNKPSQPPPPPDQRIVGVLVSWQNKTQSIRFMVNDLSARR